MDFVIAPPTQPCVPVQGSEAVFPVHRIYCVGRNYAAHAIEMGGNPDRDPPFFFQKNPDNLDLSGTFPYPPASSDVHHEIEMVVALKSGGQDIPLKKALDCVYGYGVGLDMTRRDLQGKAKDMGRPWEVGKAFEVLGAVYAAVARQCARSPLARCHLVGRQRQAQADRRSQSDDLEGSGNDQLSVRIVYIEARRRHLFRNPCRSGPSQPRRYSSWPYRQYRRSQNQSCLRRDPEQTVDG